jgi:hypothetical protein
MILWCSGTGIEISWSLDMAFLVYDYGVFVCYIDILCEKVVPKVDEICQSVLNKWSSPSKYGYGIKRDVVSVNIKYFCLGSRRFNWALQNIILWPEYRNKTAGSYLQIPTKAALIYLILCTLHSTLNILQLFQRKNIVMIGMRLKNNCQILVNGRLSCESKVCTHSFTACPNKLQQILVKDNCDDFLELVDRLQTNFELWLYTRYCVYSSNKSLLTLSCNWKL